MPKVSIIVPVYNAQDTLAACLGNLVHQTLEEIELILVNDASTDRSLQILMDCEQTYPDKVILVNLEENRGPGGARNVGLQYASGEYIGFVDSDDIADISMYEKLYTTALQNDYDMVDGAYFNECNDTLMLQTEEDCTGTLDARKRCQLISGGGYLWSRIFRKELFDGIYFRENTILEDMETMMLLFMRTQKLGTIQDVIYKYCCYPESASKLSNPNKYHKAVTDAMKAVHTSLYCQTEYSEIQTAVEYSILHLYLCGIVNTIHPNNNLPALQKNVYLKELKELRFQFVKLPYSDNPYIKQKFSPQDYQLMLETDKI